jgi:hypothetical protein
LRAGRPLASPFVGRRHGRGVGSPDANRARQDHLGFHVGPRPATRTRTATSSGVTRMRACARARHGVLSASPSANRKPAKLRCEARTRAGTACRCKALKNGRCKFHGGMSTGPRTLAGRQRIADAQRQRWRSHRAEERAANRSDDDAPILSSPRQ